MMGKHLKNIYNEVNFKVNLCNKSINTKIAWNIRSFEFYVVSNFISNVMTLEYISNIIIFYL